VGVDHGRVLRSRIGDRGRELRMTQTFVAQIDWGKKKGVAGAQKGRFGLHWTPRRATRRHPTT